MMVILCLFLDVTPCSLVDVRLRFGGIYCLHVQGIQMTILFRRFGEIFVNLLVT
jgi:hypothetical protein